MRIAVGCIGHETNTFSPVATTLNNFKKEVIIAATKLSQRFKALEQLQGVSLMLQNNSIWSLFHCYGRLRHPPEW